MQDTVGYFIALLRFSIEAASALPENTLSDSEWELVFTMAKKQSVVGMLFPAISAMPMEQRPPKHIRMQIYLTAEMLKESNRTLAERAGEITREFAQMGYRSCVLKGQGTAGLYPEPSLRNGGDIDLWVMGMRDDIIREVKCKWKTGKMCYHHIDVRPFTDKTEVEVHFTPSWMNNPFRNRRLQRYFRENAERQITPECGFAVPTIGFNLVYLAVHIYRHLLFEGIGLRQIMDYFFVLRHSSEEDRRQALDFLSSLGMRSFIGALMFVEKDLFGLGDEYLLCPEEPHFGTFLKNEIFLAGNFGKYDSRFRYDAEKNIIVRAAQRLKRLIYYFGYAPSEVLWAPYFKVWQRLRYIS